LQGEANEGRFSGNEQSIRERLEMLKAEMAEIRKAESNYRTSRSAHPAQLKEHADRLTRMKQIVDELAELMKR
jgi:hypothetical protein